MHRVFPTAEQMLDPAAVSDALAQPVETVDRAPMVPKGHSSTEAQFEGIRINGETTPSLVVKTIDRARDWVSVVTGDVVDREVAVWESGLLDMLPSEMGHAVVSAAPVNRRVVAAHAQHRRGVRCRGRVAPTGLVCRGAAVAGDDACGLLAASGARSIGTCIVRAGAALGSSGTGKAAGSPAGGPGPLHHRTDRAGLGRPRGPGGPGTGHRPAVTRRGSFSGRSCAGRPSTHPRPR